MRNIFEAVGHNYGKLMKKYFAGGFLIAGITILCTIISMLFMSMRNTDIKNAIFFSLVVYVLLIPPMGFIILKIVYELYTENTTNIKIRNIGYGIKNIFKAIGVVILSILNMKITLSIAIISGIIGIFMSSILFFTCIALLFILVYSLYAFQVAPLYIITSDEQELTMKELGRKTCEFVFNKFFSWTLVNAIINIITALVCAILNFAIASYDDFSNTKTIVVLCIIMILVISSTFMCVPYLDTFYIAGFIYLNDKLENQKLKKRQRKEAKMRNKEEEIYRRMQIDVSDPSSYKSNIDENIQARNDMKNDIKESTGFIRSNLDLIQKQSENFDYYSYYDDSNNLNDSNELFDNDIYNFDDYGSYDNSDDM